MTIPDDLDELLAQVERQHRLLEEAVADTKKETEAGRTGHAFYVKARLIEADYHRLIAAAQDRLKAALAAL